MKKITAKMLRKLGACGDPIEHLEKKFPNGMKVTVENLHQLDPWLDDLAIYWDDQPIEEDHLLTKRYGY